MLHKNNKNKHRGKTKVIKRLIDKNIDVFKRLAKK